MINLDSVALEIEKLSVIYDPGKHEKKAVDEFSLQVFEGEFFALLGPNGAGKTSVISTLTGLFDVQHGKVEIFGKAAGSIAAKRLTGVVPQELVNHGFFTVNEILNFFSGYYGIFENQKRIDYLLDRLQLTEQKDKKVAQLSGGMKRRLLIAKALVHSPKLLLLDEPSAGVDIELRALLWGFMQELNAEGMTIVLTTHYLEEAQRLCKRVAIMNYGRMLSLGNTEDLLSSMVDREVVLRIRDLSHLSGIQLNPNESRLRNIRQEDGKVFCTALGGISLHEILQALDLKLEDVVDVRMHEGSLEDAFLRIVGKDREIAQSANAH